MSSGGAEEFFRGGADHDGASLASEEDQTVFHARHHRVHIFAQGAENLVHAAKLLADLGDLAAYLAKFVAASGESRGFRGRRVELAGGNAIQLRGDVAK